MMKIRHFIPIAILLCLSAVACKKKEKAADPVESELLPVVPASDLSTAYGEVYFNESYAINRDNTMSVSRFPLEARFYEVPMSTPGGKKNVDAGAVTISGITLRKVPSAFGTWFYADSTNTLISLPAFTLAASGGTGVEKMNFQYNSGSPAFADTSLIPSEIRRSEGINLRLTNVTDADSLVFTLARDHYYRIDKQVCTKGASEARIEIKREEISGLMENYIDATISVTVFRKVFEQAGSRKYLVHSRKTYSKQVLVSFF